MNYNWREQQTYLQVGLSNLEAVILVGALDRALSLGSDTPRMTSVLLSKAQQSINGLQVCV